MLVWWAGGGGSDGVCGVEYMSECVCVCMVNLTFHSLMELMGMILLYGFR